MAALYQAMDDTLMTKSQLRASSYDDMREAITKEMLLTNSATKSWSDADLLRNFYDCEYLIAICTGWFFSLFLPIFSTKMKNDGKPIRDSVL